MSNDQYSLAAREGDFVSHSLHVEALHSVSEVTNFLVGNGRYPVTSPYFSRYGGRIYLAYDDVAHNETAFITDLFSFIGFPANDTEPVIVG
jgi:hypothetical protein